MHTPPSIAQDRFTKEMSQHLALHANSNTRLERVLWKLPDRHPLRVDNHSDMLHFKKLRVHAHPTTHRMVIKGSRVEVFQTVVGVLTPWARTVRDDSSTTHFDLRLHPILYSGGPLRSSASSTTHFDLRLHPILYSGGPLRSSANHACEAHARNGAQTPRKINRP